MDLRVVKTRKAIREAFLAIRRTTPLEKVRVRDICREALINKSTFYHHYEDAFDLSDQLEDEVIEQCFADFKYKDCLFSDPRRFFENVPASLDRMGDLIDVLFDGRMDVLYRKLQRQIRTMYLAPGATAEQEVLLAFVVGGALFAMQELSEEGNRTPAEITDATARIVEHLRQLEAGA